MNKACEEHSYTYQGVKYQIHDAFHPSSSKPIYYYDCYYCTKCTDIQIKLIEQGHTLGHIKYNATPLGKY